MFIRTFRFKGGSGGNSRVFRNLKSNGVSILMEIDTDEDWTQASFPDVLHRKRLDV